MRLGAGAAAPATMSDTRDRPDRLPCKTHATPTRILHVVGAWGRGGTETWLMHVLKNIDRERFRIDFLVHTATPSAFDAAVSERGARLIRCLHSSRPLLYARQLTSILKKHGPYDIIHCHVHYFSGYVLWLAFKAGVPQRIVHSHCDTSYEDDPAPWWRMLYLQVMRAAISRYATCGIAASEKAGQALHGRKWKADPRWRKMYCGIDLGPFRVPVDRSVVRREIGVPKDGLVVGHVGGFRRPKNHSFLVRIVACLVRDVPNVFLLLVGEGPLRKHIAEEAAAAGIADRLIFTGVRDDVRRLLAAMDVFVFPSFGEGAPLAVLEAQAAGIPCVLSDVITEEVDVVPPLIRRHSLGQPASDWAKAIMQLSYCPERIRPDAALELVEQSPFSSAISARELEKLYTAV